MGIKITTVLFSLLVLIAPCHSNGNNSDSAWIYLKNEKIIKCRVYRFTEIEIWTTQGVVKTDSVAKYRFIIEQEKATKNASEADFVYAIPGILLFGFLWYNGIPQAWYKLIVGDY